MSDRRIDASELHALVDGELDPARQAEVEAWLTRNPEDAKRVAGYRAQNAGMHALFDGIIDEDLPPIIASELVVHRQWLHRGGAIAAGIALMIAGAVVGWVARGEMAPSNDGTTQVAQAAPPIDTKELMVRAAMAHTVNSDEDLHLASSENLSDTSQYMTTRMGETVRVPQLSSLGYELIGSRVLPDTAGPAAQFVFEETDGARVTLYVRGEAADGVDITYALADDLTMFYWNDSNHSYALVREIDDETGREALLKAAKAVYRQIAE